MYATYDPLATGRQVAYVVGAAALALELMKLGQAAAIAGYFLERTLATGKAPKALHLSRESSVSLKSLMEDYLKAIQAIEDLFPKGMELDLADDNGELSQWSSEILSAETPAIPSGISYPVEGEMVRDIEEVLEELLNELEKIAQVRIAGAAIDDGQASLDKLDKKTFESTQAKAKAEVEALTRVALNAGSSVGNQAANAMRTTGIGLGQSEREEWAQPRYIRISTTGSPCAWCAMLMSRGPAYLSAETAEMTSDPRSQKARERAGKIARYGEPFHDNDKCEVIKVWDKSEYLTSPDFAFNRALAIEWKVAANEFTAGRMADQLNNWRRYWYWRSKDPMKRGQETRARYKK